MKRYIVLSVNDNPDYLYFTPLTCWAWLKFGWEPIVFYTRTEPRNELTILLETLTGEFIGVTQPQRIIRTNDFSGYRSDTITQVSRLYAACVQDGYLMTGDIDMIPLSDYWQFNEKEITVWGHDLTGYSHYPICYIGMPSEKWKEVMWIDSGDYNGLIKKQLDLISEAKESAGWEKRWFTDQEIITKRLKRYNQKQIVNRGQYSNGYAVGRVDRGSWSLNHSTFIDAHLFQQLYFKQNQDKFDKTMELLTSIWPDEDFGWWISYTKEFRKLTGHS